MLLVEELDDSERPIFRYAELPAGHRAEARHQLLIDLLNKAPTPSMIGLVDLEHMPRHILVVIGHKDEDGAIELTEGAESRVTARGVLIVKNIEEALKNGGHLGRPRTPARAAA